MGYPVRSHLEPHGDVQPPHDPADMSPPGSHLPHSPARHPSAIHHPLGAADRSHPARPPSCRPTAIAAPDIPSSSTDRCHPARRSSPRPPTTARPPLTDTDRPSPPVRIPHGFRPTDTHMIRVLSPARTAPARQLSSRPARPVPPDWITPDPCARLPRAQSPPVRHSTIRHMPVRHPLTRVGAPP